MPKVPEVDNQPTHAGDPSPEGRLEAIELRVLDADAKAKEKGNREADQRYWLRWLAVGAAALIIVGMSCLLAHVSHRLMTLKAFGSSTSYVIALYVAPIFSMTTLSIALLIAAFRGFKETDGTNATSAASDGVRIGIGGG